MTLILIVWATCFAGVLAILVKERNAFVDKMRDEEEMKRITDEKTLMDFRAGIYKSVSNGDVKEA